MKKLSVEFLTTLTLLKKHISENSFPAKPAQKYILVLFFLVFGNTLVAQDTCCSGLRNDDFSFVQYCLKDVSPCTPGTGPCNEATFRAIFGLPTATWIFQCLDPALGCGTGACGGGDMTLPVDLLSFDLIIATESITLNWSTSAEVNNEGFFVERSTDGVNWTPISFIDGFGDSENLKNYSFSDTEPILGANYYRLKQMDFDGAFEYSPVIVALWRGTPDDLKMIVLPNPATSWISPVIPSELGTYEKLNFEILDINGRLIRKETKPLAHEGIRFNVSDLSGGSYILRVVTEQRVYSSKFLKK